MRIYNTYFYDTKPSWEEVPTAPIDIFQWESEEKYRPYSYAKMCFVRNEGIYFLLMSRESEPKATYTKTDEPMYKDSCLEAFISLDGKSYLNIETNPNGAYLAQFGENRYDRRFLKEITDKKPVVTRVNSGDMWGNEIFVSQALIRDLFGDYDIMHDGVFRGNFYKCGDETHTAHYGSFSPMGSLELGFHDPDLFAKIFVENEVFSNEKR